MVRCISSAKYTMTATVLSRLPSDGIPASDRGTWKYEQDESGEIKTVFVPDDKVPKTDPLASYDIQLYARGYTDLGFRSSANLETILKGGYSIREVIECHWGPQHKNLNRQSYLTNIRDTRSGNTLWTEEESGVPTVFQIQGVTPVFDAFGRQVSWISVATRAEIQ